MPFPGRDTAEWGAEEWEAAQRLIFYQGVGPLLHRRFAGSEGALPADFRFWLAEQYRCSALRADSLQAELGVILSACQQASLAVMPLKGSLLARREYPDPALRPMADLDLLVRPADRSRLAEILTALGYSLQPPGNRFPHHDHFANPGGERVVSFETEHPDNPRPVEVHTAVRRPLLGGRISLDLAPLLWESAVRAPLLGAEAWIPCDESLLLDLALHNLQNLLLYRNARLIQWVDLALVAALIPDLSCLPHPRLLYPTLRLASRALPRQLPPAALDGLAAGVPARVRRWCAQVPLDARCGLASAPLPRSRWRKRWQRWAPSAVRLLVNYEEESLGRAVWRYAGDVVRG